jgi:prepilin-type N-terminal cleavage/methylation domain-containing protein
MAKRILQDKRGSSLLEILISLAIMGIVASAFLGGLGTSSKTASMINTHDTARNLAEAQTEYIKHLPFAASYSPTTIPSEYSDYTADIDTQTLQDGHLQRVTITIRRYGDTVTQLETYKVD